MRGEGWRRSTGLQRRTEGRHGREDSARSDGHGCAVPVEAEQREDLDGRGGDGSTEPGGASRRKEQSSDGRPACGVRLQTLGMGLLGRLGPTVPACFSRALFLPQKKSSCINEIEN